MTSHPKHFPCLWTIVLLLKLHNCIYFPIGALLFSGEGGPSIHMYNNLLYWSFGKALAAPKHERYETKLLLTAFTLARVQDDSLVLSALDILQCLVEVLSAGFD